MPMVMLAKVKLTQTLGLRRYYLFFQPPTVNKKTMKTTSFKQSILIFTLLIIFTFSSMAQRIISSLSDGEIAKGTDQWYRAKITNNQILIENTQNKFTNVKQYSPNMDPTYRPSKFEISLDKDRLLSMCCKNVSQQQLETLALGNQYAGVMINIRTDNSGKIIEINFFMDKNSSLNLQQIEQIENDIKLSKDLIKITPNMQKILAGSNYWLIYPYMVFSTMLKMKKEMERSTRPIRNERN
jgi:hypothetical protein